MFRSNCRSESFQSQDLSYTAWTMELYTLWRYRLAVYGHLEDMRADFDCFDLCLILLTCLHNQTQCLHVWQTDTFMKGYLLKYCLYPCSRRFWPAHDRVTCFNSCPSVRKPHPFNGPTKIRRWRRDKNSSTKSRRQSVSRGTGTNHLC